MLTAFGLKIIAVITMCFDHVGYILFNSQLSWCNIIGRIAFPIFAFQISEGYIHTHNLKNYFWRLFLFALISQIPYNFYEYAIGFPYTLNIFFTLFLGLCTIYAYDKIPSKFIGIIVVCGLVALGELINVDYGYWGVLLVFSFFVFKKNKVLLTFGYLGIVALKYIPLLIQFNYHVFYVELFIGTFLAIVPILLYNGKLGRKTGKLLYVFYPLHLFILASINWFNKLYILY